MLTKTSVNVLKVLVARGLFEDIYDAANTIISLAPYPVVIQAYLQTIDISSIDFSSESTSVVKPVKVEVRSEPEMVHVRDDIGYISQAESAKQAILNLRI
jgi:hypothetical protein